MRLASSARNAQTHWLTNLLERKRTKFSVWTVSTISFQSDVKGAKKYSVEVKTVKKLIFSIVSTIHCLQFQGAPRIEYRGNAWHEQCYKCAKCNSVIGGGDFIPKGNDFLCNNCFDQDFSTKCTVCAQVPIYHS